MSPRPSTDALTAVYVCWAGDELLYIGATRQPLRRYRHHRGLARWWPRVDHINLEWYSTRAEAESMERSLIDQYRPTHNSRYHFSDQPMPTMETGQTFHSQGAG